MSKMIYVITSTRYANSQMNYIEGVTEDHEIAQALFKITLHKYDNAKIKEFECLEDTQILETANQYTFIYQVEFHTDGSLLYGPKILHCRLKSDIESNYNLPNDSKFPDVKEDTHHNTTVTCVADSAEEALEIASKARREYFIKTLNLEGV